MRLAAALGNYWVLTLYTYLGSAMPTFASKLFVKPTFAQSQRNGALSKSALPPLPATEMLRFARMAAMRAATAEYCLPGEGLERAVRVERPKGLYFNGLSNRQGIFQLHAKISDGAIHLRVSQQ